MEQDSWDIFFEEEGDKAENEEDQFDDEELEDYEEEELKEIFVAGWKATQKTAEFRKNRGWKPSG